MIPENTERLLDELPILGAVAVIGDERTDTTIIERVPAGGLLDRERELLEVADERMPTRPFDVIDVLIVDALGKDQRPGMDTDVIGRRPFAINEPEPDRPDINRLYVRP
jgi:hypothetical protein